MGVSRLLRQSLFGMVFFAQVIGHQIPHIGPQTPKAGPQIPKAGPHFPWAGPQNLRPGALTDP